jgi:hypothetical protein
VPLKNADRVQEATVQQQRFVAFLLEDPNHKPVEAARKAGYKNPGVSAGDLMKLPAVKTLLRRSMRKREKATGITQQKVLRHLWNIATRDPAAIQKPDGTPITNLHELPLEVRLAIDGVKIKEKRYIAKGELEEGEEAEIVERELEYKFVAKSPIWDMLAKHVGLFEKDNEQQKGPTVVYNFGDLYAAPPDASPEHDPVEHAILEVRPENPTPQRRTRPRPLPPPKKEEKVSYTLDELLGEGEE